MRDLTADEQELRDRRKTGAAHFIADRMPVLADFAEALGLHEPPMIVADPQRYLPSVHDFMQHQAITPDDRSWILLRLGYLIGELLIARVGGVWMLNEIPDTRTFLRYVVQFPHAAVPGAMVDPFEPAAAFIDSPAPRNLTALINQIEAELRG